MAFGRDILDFGQAGVKHTPGGRGDAKARDIELLLDQAFRWWDKRSDFRTRRARSRNYRRGKQWEEEITNDSGDVVTEEAFIKSQGRVPWVMNQVDAIMRNLKGQYRQNRSERAVFAVNREDTEGVEMMNVALRAVRRSEVMRVLEADQFEEHLTSGSSCWKVSIDFDEDLQRESVRVDAVDQTRLFYNLDIDDRRMRGLRMVGELHDMTKDELVTSFALDGEGNYSDRAAELILEAYGADERRVPVLDVFAEVGFTREDALDFYAVHDMGLHRVIEVWVEHHEVLRYLYDPNSGTYEESDITRAELSELNRMVAGAVSASNVERMALGLGGVEFRELELVKRREPVWWVYYLSPRGDVLFESRTPYWHKSHPYVLSLSNLLDGETWGLVEQIIDPQRWLNRLVVQIDHAMGVGAKGVLVVPEEVIPDDMSLEDFAETWSKTAGVLKIKLKPGAPVPQQIVASAIQPGSFELLGQLRQWLDEVSGVSGPLRGFEPKAGTPAALFQQQVIQSSLTNLDYFESFFEGLFALDYKVVKTILQAVDEPRLYAEGNTRRAVRYDPARVRELEFAVSMGSVADTATFRQLFESDLLNFLQAGFLDFGTYLELSAHPKAETLLRILQRRDPQMLELGTTEISAAMQALQDGGSLPAVPGRAEAGAQLPPAGGGDAASPGPAPQPATGPNAPFA